MEKPVVLLVEDDDHALFLMQHAFAEACPRLRLEAVSTGDQAVAYLLGEGRYADRGQYPLPALILLDLSMPRTTGLDVLAWIRARPGLRRVPVIVQSLSANPEEINRAYDLGANSYVVKPLHFHELLDLLRVIEAYWIRTHQPGDLAARPEAQPA